MMPSVPHAIARPRRRPLAVLALLLAACTSPRAVHTAAPEVRRGAPIEAAEALATFDAVWTTVRDQHYDPALGGLDWDAVRDELRPRAEAARDTEELRGVVREMLGRLGQSHFALLPGDDAGLDEPEGTATGGAREAWVGIDVRVREDRMLVSSVRPGSPAERAGVRPGWTLERVAGFDCGDLLQRLAGREARQAAFGARQRVAHELAGATGSSVTLLLRDLDDRPRTLELERVPRDVLRAEFGNLPTMEIDFERTVREVEGRRIGVIHFTNWFLPVARPLDEAMDELRDAEGIVLDLRGNGGGALSLVMGLAGHFFPDRRELGTQVMRDAHLTYRANPRLVDLEGNRVEPFAGPLAILVDETSGSASEVFAGALQSVGRARVFGETSMGAVLPSRTTALPGGDVLLHAFADFHTPDGTRLEGRGVVPDESVPLSREVLAPGGDPQLEAALLWLASVSETSAPSR